MGWHDDFENRPICICAGFVGGGICVMSSSTSRFGVVALSVMRVMCDGFAFVDNGSKEAGLSQNPIMHRLSKHSSSDGGLVFCGLQCRHITLLN